MMVETNLEKKMSIDAYLEEESEEKRLERERILNESTAQKTTLNREQVQALLKDCQITTQQATKTKEDLGDYLDKLHEHQAKLLEKALGACERQFGGGPGFRHNLGSALPVISEVAEIGGVKLEKGQPKVICNCGPGAKAHLKQASCV